MADLSIWNHVKSFLLYTFGALLAVVAPIYIWWSILTLTYDPGDELHSINERFVETAHWGLIPMGHAFGYTEAARAVEGMYEEGPDIRHTDMSADDIKDWFFRSSTIVQTIADNRRAIGGEIGGCSNSTLMWTGTSVWTDTSDLLSDRSHFAALAGGDLTVCKLNASRYTVRLEVQIRWTPHVVFPIPFPPIFVHEGLLDYVAQHSDDIQYYTRVYEFEYKR